MRWLWLLFAALAGCSGGSEPVRPNVLIITLDTTRADFVGRDRHTPAIGDFLDGATHFRGARSVAPLTLPAHVSLFSGLQPARTGIHDNVTSPLPKEREFPLLAEELSAAGYETAAFASCAVVGARTGLDAGFAVYECPVDTGAQMDNFGHVPCEETLAKASAWLKERGDRPWFVWVHFFDPHAPYLPYAGDARRTGTGEGATARDLYAGEVRRADAAIEQLLKTVGDDTIIVIATDHGEGLGDHEPAHGPLCFGSVIDVFLGVRGPGLEPGSVADGPRSLVDIAPTLRAWCGLAEQPHDGARLFDPPRPVVVSESLYTWRIHGWGQCFAATDGRYSLVESGAKVEFFDRSVDPLETHPIEPAGHEAYERLDRALRAFREQNTEQAPASALFDSGTPYGAARRPLQTYLSRRDNARLPDPRTRFAFWRMLDSTMGLIQMGSQRGDKLMLGRAIAQLEALGEVDPKNPAPPSYLLRAQERMAAVTGVRRWHRDAARSARAAIERGYRVAPMLHALLEQSLAGGHPDDLRAALDFAMERRIVPDRHCVELCESVARALGDEASRRKAATYRERAEPYLEQNG